jgi:hypothetical protein
MTSAGTACCHAQAAAVSDARLQPIRLRLPPYGCLCRSRRQKKFKKSFGQRHPLSIPNPKGREILIKEDQNVFPDSTFLQQRGSCETPPGGLVFSRNNQRYFVSNRNRCPAQTSFGCRSAAHASLCSSSRRRERALPHRRDQCPKPNSQIAAYASITDHFMKNEKNEKNANRRHPVCACNSK